VQRPDIEIKVKADLGIMLDVAVMLEKRTTWAANYNVAGIVDEFASNVLEELDYRNEAYNLRRLADNMSEYALVQVPAVYPGYFTSKVLAMDFCKGVKITEVDRIVAAGLDRTQLAREFTNAMVKQLLFDGFFHADPHPGNVLVDLESGRIVFLDLGMVGMLTKEQRMNLADLIWSIKEADPSELARVITSLSTEYKPVDKKAFERDLDRLITRYMVYGDDETGGFSELMSATLGLLYKHGLRLHPDYTLAVKSLTQAEEIARTLDPEMSIVDTAYAEARRLAVTELSPERIEAIVRRQATRSAKEVVRRLPSLQDATIKWLDQYQSGKMTLHVDTESLSDRISGFSDAVRQLSIAILLSGMIVGSAVAVNLSGRTAWRHLPEFLALVFLAATVFAAIWVVGVVRGQVRDD
jgi:ubiquinone biosynthesis protein